MDAIRAEYAVALELERADMCGNEAPAHETSNTERARRVAIRDCLET